MSRLQAAHDVSSHRALRYGGGSLPLLVISAIAAVALLIGIAGYFLFVDDREAVNDPFIHVVQRGPFVHVVAEKGELESSNNVEVRCGVKARKSVGTEMIWVIDEGAEVEKDKLLAQLDSSGLELDRVQQEITCSNAEALMINAKNDYESAVIDKKEYLEGTYKQEQQELQKAIFAAQKSIFEAEEARRRSEEYAQYSERLAAKGYITELQLIADRFAVEKAGKDLEEAREDLKLAQTKLHVLETYTKEKQLKTKDAAIATAKAKATAEETRYKLEMENLQEIEDQIDLCTIKAPAAGTVVYANQRSWRGGSSEFVVEPGAIVRENQVVFRLPDPTQMQVKCEISETDIGLIAVGMPATIRMGTNDDQAMQGEVDKVNEYPEPNWHSSAPKEYLVFVRIDDPPPTLRTGLTAKVEIVVNQVPDAVQVPIQAVWLHGDKHFCFVQDRDGDWYATEVKLGAANNEMVIVESGLDEGVPVTLTPQRYLDEVDLPEIPATATGPQVDQTAVESGPRGAAAQRDGAPGNPEALVRRIVQQHDRNGDGSLSGDEIPQGDRQRLLRADSNSDGVITSAELSRALDRRKTASPPSQPGGQGRGEGGR
jgi:multidrug efflux pump subunit AcrA (membrane-fusion protein)